MDKSGLMNIEINKYLKIVFKRKFLFIFLSLGIMSIVVWGSYFLPKEYEAKSTIFIETNVIKNLVSGIAITPSMEDRIKVLRYSMISRGLISKVLSDLDVDLKIKGNDFENMITAFQQRTRINMRGNDLFIISIQDSNPKFAMDYVNALVRRYVEENILAKRDEAYGANRFLGEQVASFKEKLDKSDEAIINFRKEKGIYVAIDEATLVNEIKEYKGEIEKINVKLNELNATKNRLTKQLEGEEPMTVAFARHVGSVTKDASIEALENRMKQLLIRYTENYPEVVKLKAETEILKKQKASQSPFSDTEANKITEPEMSTINPVFQGIKQNLLQTDTEIEALNAKKNQFAILIGKREAELRYIPEGKKQLSDLVKERDTNKQIYEQLLTRVGQSEVSKQMEIEDKATTFKIVDPAVLSTKPVSPNRVRLIIIGIFLGFLGGFGGTIIRESFDFSVKDVHTLQNLGVDVLAVIPKIFNEEEQKKKVKKEKVIYTIAGSYFFIICLSLIHEVMELTYIDNLFSHLHI